jgi:hypothetical protein
MTESVIGRRCVSACKTWPDYEEYGVCAVCLEPTRRFRGLTPITQDQAVTAVKHAEFDRFYAEEWVQDTTELTDEDLLEMGIDVNKQALPSAPVPPVPPAKNPARIPRSSHRFSGRPGTSAPAS